MIVMADALHLPFRSHCAHAIVTDPPAGISFMGRKWDHDKGGRRQWVDWMAKAASEALRVAKPGAYGFFWALPRTSHWTAWALEEAGWSVRDCVTHLFGSGFPKSHNVGLAVDRLVGTESQVVGEATYSDSAYMRASRVEQGHRPNLTNQNGQLRTPSSDEAKQWDGFGSALKPSVEFWWLVQKPFRGSIAANVLEHGCGALNIDSGRVPTSDNLGGGVVSSRSDGWDRPWKNDPMAIAKAKERSANRPPGRWPSNLFLTHSASCEPGRPCADDCPVAIVDSQSGVSTSTPMEHGGKGMQNAYAQDSYSKNWVRSGCDRSDSGGASRFFRCFYQAKPSTAERGRHNTHPTVKAIGLMEYLIRLICPVGGFVIDPFAGSCTTLKAAVRTGRRAAGCDLEEEHVSIGKRRLEKTQRGLF